MKKNNSYVLVLGASIVDIIGFSHKTYRSMDSIPGKIKISFGGVCRNIAENMARVGVNTEFISVLGNDEQGVDILKHSELIGYKMEHSLILEDKATPTYMAILDDQGEMVSAVVDMDSINEIDEKFIDSKKDIICNAEYTFLDTDNPKLLEYILKTCEGQTKFILDTVSAVKAEKVKHLLKYFHTIKPNRHEAEVLSGITINSMEDVEKAAEYFLSLGITNVFISLDEDGTFYKNKSEHGVVKACYSVVKNTTGAGDSFVAGIGYGYMNGLSMRDTAKYATAMAVITICHESTINPCMSNELVEEYLNSIKWHEC